MKLAGAAAGTLAFPGALSARATAGPPEPTTAAQGIDPLPGAVYTRRLERAAELMRERGLVAIFAEPSTNLAYLLGASFQRSERLIGLILTANAKPFLVAPVFELERIQRSVRVVPDLRGWSESMDPYRVVSDVIWTHGPGRIAIEPSTRYGVVRRLQQALPNWQFSDADPVFTRLRIIKSEDELTLIRRAISITETSIAATFGALEAGVTDREVAALLSREMGARGARGGGLVQFGATSALPHGGTEGRELERGMPVLIDAGCDVHDYTSDITRMHFFGDEPGPEYRDVYNTVFAAQSAAYNAGKPGMESQQLDRIARRVIDQAGYGEYFTHRLGHGLGMDGHEPPYLVEGNTRILEPGMVFTIEPGIYLPDRWGVRIEDDFVVRDDRLEPLSSRVEAFTR